MESIKNWMRDAANILFDDSKNDLRALPKTVRLQILLVLSFIWTTVFSLYVFSYTTFAFGWAGLFIAHIGLIFAKEYPEMVKGLILTGSSGLFENSMGDSFPRRGDYNYIKKKTEEVFYDPKVATKELVDRVFKLANNRINLLKLLGYAKSAIRHNMAEDIPNLKMPVSLIWGKNDKVTPPHVAKEFHKLLPNSELNWIPLCGHAAMWEHPKKFSEIVLKFLKNYF